MQRRIALALVVLLAPAFASAEQVLRVSVIPDEAPFLLQRRFAPLGAYLEQRLGVAVQFVPVSDYAAAVEGLVTKRLDLVWYGGFTFVQARLRSGNALPLVQRAEDGAFRSRIIVPAGSRAAALRDLKGKNFAFGQVSSTSGHLMPRYFLIRNGVDPDRDFAKVVYSGADELTARWVEAGRVDAGAISEAAYQRFLGEKRLDPSKVRVLWTTPPFCDYSWTVRGDLDPRLVEKLRAAFLALDPGKPGQREILELQRTRRFIPTSAENFTPIEDAARSAGLLRD